MLSLDLSQFFQNENVVIVCILSLYNLFTGITENSSQTFHQEQSKLNCQFSLFTCQPIPKGYRDKYMPRHPAMLTCIRDGKQYQIKYLPHKYSLSAGWKNFCRSNGLQADDELVFFRLDNSTYQVGF